MKKIKFYCQDTIGAQIADVWYASKQASGHNHFAVDQTALPSGKQPYAIDNDCVNIAIASQWDENFLDQRDRFDLVFLCNAGEPLEVSSPRIKSILNEHNVFLVANARLSPAHDMYHKVVWFPHNIMTCHDYWTRHFYLQYFQNTKLSKLGRTDSMIWINGANRANRKYFWSQLSKALPNLKTHASNYCSTDMSLDECQWETTHDQSFRMAVNDLVSHIEESSHSIYYQNSPTIGINGKFGIIPPGYFLLPLYYSTRCVIFPETCWINDELAVTEKALKCFYSGSLAFPVGGANVHRLYNEIGFETAWHVLPQHLQAFDQQPDHFQRIKGVVKAIDWLCRNSEILSSPLAQEITRKNRERFLSNATQIAYVDQFDKIIHSAL